MDFLELQDTLQNLTNTKIKQSEIAKSIGIFRSSLSRKISTHQQVSNEEMMQVAKYFNVNLEALRDSTMLNAGGICLDMQKLTYKDTANKECANIDYYPEQYASCGGGTFVINAEKEKLQVPVSIFRTHDAKDYFAITARGDSMQPHILPNDILIVRHCEGESIYDNKIYVFYYNDCIYTKRLVMNIDEILVKSDNPEYERKSIKDFDKFRLLGEVIGLMRKE